MVEVHLVPHLATRNSPEWQHQNFLFPLCEAEKKYDDLKNVKKDQMRIKNVKKRPNANTSCILHTVYTKSYESLSERQIECKEGHCVFW